MALIIGDIHGCLFQLKNLLDFAQPSAEQTIVTLGDYIDRGENSKGVLDFLIQLKNSHELVHLKGNHDAYLENVQADPALYKFWLKPELGGRATLASYQDDLENVPRSHWEFLENSPFFYETEDLICVHGGLIPSLPMVQQKAETLMNLRFHTAKAHHSGKLVVCGHTRQIDGSPRLHNNTLCIDTNVFDGGYLTAYDSESKKFYQVNAHGERKSFSIEDIHSE
ncbi:metallophosphoesterase family protein [Rubritalea spongiae]|uniref:Metallophosphoesterase family protein n=1 Tax=Rubritalea spongiae TaxID=430797 RepID=A0ABW5E5N8_9BACT